jgi:hypothetical protein
MPQHGDHLACVLAGLSLSIGFGRNKKTVQLALGRIAKAEKSSTNEAARMSEATGACMNSSG